MTKQYDNYADLITFTRASGGTALRHVGYGTELVTNGTFDDGTTGFGAIGGASISYSAGENALEVNVTGSGGGFAETQTLATTIGKVYLVSITVKKTTFSGNIHWNIDGVNQGSFTPTTEYQTFSKPFVATDASLDVGFPRESSPTGIYFVREVSVKEVIFDRATDPLVLFNHPTNTPRIEYDADGNRLGLLIEEARTNLLTYSEEFDGGSWLTSRASISPDTTTAPDGETTADSLIEDGTASASHGAVRQTITYSAGNYTFSCFAKKNTRNFIRLYVDDELNSAGVNISAYFDLNNGLVGTQVNTTTAKIEPYSNGWYRCSVTFTAVAGSSTGAQIYLTLADNTATYNGDGTSGVYFWGAQLEVGSFPTSYIPTSGSTATRAADVASIPTSAFGYNQKAGTLVVEAITPISNNENRMVALAQTGSNSRVVDLLRVASEVQMFNGTANLTGGSIVSPYSLKAAGVYASGDYALIVDGAVIGSRTDALVNTVNTLSIGMNVLSARQLNGHIKSLQYYPRRLTNAQLQELTA